MARVTTVFFILVIFLFPGLLSAQTEDHQHKLIVTPANLNFFTCAEEGQPATAPESQRLQIRGVPNSRVHDGDDSRSAKNSLEWTATPDEAWIQIEPSSGFTPDEAAVTIDPAGLEAGEYNGTIRFDTPGQQKPRIVQIKLRIQTATALKFTLAPADISFSGEAFSNVTLIDSVQLGTVGGEQIDFTATNSQSWLQAVPSQATAPITVLLLADVASLPAGTYYDTVFFRSADGGSSGNGEGHCLLDATSIRLPVTLTVTSTGKPKLVVTPNRLGFAATFGGPNPRPQQLQISAEGAREIPWTTTFYSSDLYISPGSGVAGSSPSTITVYIDIDSLSPGLYQYLIDFQSTLPDVDPVFMSVFLQIFPPSELSDSVAIGDGVVDLTDPQINRFSVPIFASNTQAIRGIALPLHFEDGQTNLDSVVFAGGRAEFADLKLFLSLAEPGDFLVLIGFILAPALPPGEGTIGWLHFTTTGVLPQFADTLVIDSTSVPNSTGDPNLPQSLSVSYLVFSGDNPLILNPAFKKGTVLLRNSQIPTSADDGDGHRPMNFGLNQNYPNPFNPQTAIAFSLPKNSEVKLEVFDLLGRSVVTLKEGQVRAGTHTIVWDGRDRTGQTVASGVYLYRLKADGFVETKKMLHLK